jgi:biopolymer transport protein ExbD
MWTLLACSVVAVTTIILHTLALREKNVLPLTIESEIERLAPGTSPERLARMVHHDPSSLALQADKKASFGTIIKVMDALKLAGVKNLPAFTREEK